MNIGDGCREKLFTNFNEYDIIRLFIYKFIMISVEGSRCVVNE